MECVKKYMLCFVHIDYMTSPPSNLSVLQTSPPSNLSALRAPPLSGEANLSVLRTPPLSGEANLSALRAPFPPETGTLLSAPQTFPLTGEFPFRGGNIILANKSKKAPKGFFYLLSVPASFFAALPRSKLGARKGRAITLTGLLARTKERTIVSPK